MNVNLTLEMNTKDRGGIKIISYYKLVDFTVIYLIAIKYQSSEGNVVRNYSTIWHFSEFKS